MTMNRQARRAAVKRVKPMPSKNDKPTPIREAGTFRMPLENPEPCGEISIAEAAEIKARVELAKTLEKDATDTADQLNKTNQLRRIVMNEHQGFLRKLLEAHGLDMADEYRVNPDDGSIMRVARGGTPQFEEAPSEGSNDGAEAEVLEAVPAAE